jgi:hypothetical protein
VASLESVPFSSTHTSQQPLQMRHQPFHQRTAGPPEGLFGVEGISSATPTQSSSKWYVSANLPVPSSLTPPPQHPPALLPAGYRPPPPA